MGVDDPEHRKEPGDNLLGLRNRLIVALVFVALYAVTFVPRQGGVAPWVSALLGGAVVFLLLKEVDERRKRRRR